MNALLLYLNSKTYWVGKTDRHSVEDKDDCSDVHLDDDSSASSAEEGKDLVDSMNDENEDATSDDGGSTAESVKTKDTEWSSLSGSPPDTPERTLSENTERKIDVVFDILLSQLKQIVANRPKTGEKRTSLNDLVIKSLEKYLGSDQTVLEEAAEFNYIEIPDWKINRSDRDPDSMALDSVVQQQLHKFVEDVASMHNENSFHGFDHAGTKIMGFDRKLTCL